MIRNTLTWERYVMAERIERFTSDQSGSAAGRSSSPAEAATPESFPPVERDAAKKWPTSAEQFDQMFDDGEDIDHLIDWAKATRPGLKPRRVNVDIPEWMVRCLDMQARKRGVTRQALIKMWLADRLEAAG